MGIIFIHLCFYCFFLLGAVPWPRGFLTSRLFDFAVLWLELELSLGASSIRQSLTKEGRKEAERKKGKQKKGNKGREQGKREGFFRMFHDNHQNFVIFCNFLQFASLPFPFLFIIIVAVHCFSIIITNDHHMSVCFIIVLKHRV